MSELSQSENTIKPALSDRQRRIVTIIVLLIGLFFVVFFGLRAYHGLRRLIEGTQPIVRPWMTIPRLSRQFKIPETDLYQALDVTPQRPDPRPLDKLAREKGLMPHIFVEQVQRFVDTYPKPPPSLTPPSLTPQPLTPSPATQPAP